MVGIGSTFDIASQALNVYQSALNVTSCNIANVDTETYSRQIVALNPGQSIQTGGLIFGSGVEIEQVQSACDQILEDRLYEKKSDLAAYEEETVYLSMLEALFDENAVSSINDLMTVFWNSWQDLSNNPSGSAERAVLCESGKIISEQFSALSDDLMQMETDITREIEAALEEINTIAEEIAAINQEIVSVEAGGSATANNLRDQRNALLTALSERIEFNTFEQNDGSLIVSVAGGYTLVDGSDTVSLDLSGGQVMWEKSTGNVDITDLISGGSMEGWLAVRDEILPEYAANLDALSKEFLWAVNLQHTQGSGLCYFDTAITGTYETDATGLLSSLSFADRIDTSKDLKIWIQDSSTDPPTFTDVTVDLSGAAPVSSADMSLSGTANSVLDTYTFTVTPPGADIGGAAAVDVAWTNSRTSGTFTADAGDVPFTAEVDGMQIDFTAAAGPFSQDTFVITTDADGSPSENLSSYTLTDLAADINTAVTAAGGGITAAVDGQQLTLTPDSSDVSFAFGDDGATGFEESGMAAALGFNTFFSGDDALTIGVNDLLSETDYIAAGIIDATSGACATGDNTNAKAIADLQDTDIDIPRWRFERGSDACSTASEDTPASFYASMISSLGIKIQSVERQTEYGEAMVEDLQAQRDAISAVSLDEEMINLSKYQAAYSAASKLLTVADEMLETLLAIR